MSEDACRRVRRARAEVMAAALTVYQAGIVVGNLVAAAAGLATLRAADDAVYNSH